MVNRAVVPVAVVREALFAEALRNDVLDAYIVAVDTSRVETIDEFIC